MNLNELETFEQIADHVENLLNIDSDNLDAEALRNSKIFVELNRIYTIQSRKLIKLIQQSDKVEHAWSKHYAGKQTREWYKQNPQNEAVLKGDIPLLLKVHPEVLEVKGLVVEQERICKFLEDSKDRLKSRTFDLKNAIEFRKMMMGM